MKHQLCVTDMRLLPDSGEMSMDVELRGVDLHLIGQDLNDSSGRRGVLYTEEEHMF